MRDRQGTIMILARLGLMILIVNSCGHFDGSFRLRESFLSTRASGISSMMLRAKWTLSRGLDGRWKNK
jgi:hypothetical protein